MLRTALTALAFTTLLSGCGSTMAPTDLARLDGNWEGDIARARSEQKFCRQWGLRLVIRKGAVTGEAFDLNARNAPAPFETFIETDGRMFIDAHVGGDVVRISGTFSNNSFSGESQATGGCRGFVSLARSRGSR